MKLLTVILAAGTLAWAQSPATPVMPVVPPQHYEALKQFLVLTDAQLNALIEVQRTRQNAEQAIWEQMRERQVELDRLLNAGSNDTAAIGRLMVEINNLRRQLPLSGAPYRTSALAVLNEAQKAKLPQLAQALTLQIPAGNAVSLNLIDGPPVTPYPRILPAVPGEPSVNVISEP